MSFLFRLCSEHFLRSGSIVMDYPPVIDIADSPPPLLDIAEDCSPLVIHERRFYRCYLCEKEFTQRSHLNRHRRVHNPKKTHVCNVCRKAFARKKNMLDHCRIHQKTDTFSCVYCSKTFYQRIRLNKHQKEHSKVDGTSQDGLNVERSAPLPAPSAVIPPKEKIGK